MTMTNKTLTPLGNLVAVDGVPAHSTQMIENIVDDVIANTAAIAAQAVADAVVTDALDARIEALETESAAAFSAQLLSVGPIAVRDADIVHALYDDSTAEFPGPFTNPVSPRNLAVLFSADWDGGDVTVVGTDQFDEPVSEVFADVGGTTVDGVKIFKTVTGATKETAAGVTGDGASIGTGDKVGLTVVLADAVGQLQVGVTPEAVTLDATYQAFTPTTVPSDTTYVLLANVSV